ncbi:Alpha/Beta hydrolase protein [Lophiotrema nucula]|uniref:Alpha/Beta hydrolase protein n=1 Tax=Lophiotrema nucula TaxID=690887 RepID=A0A6A5YEQ1_9PLEO|nr:Alpha/Beta hydrolase protein [Lophiotrema nucula]
MSSTDPASQQVQYFSIPNFKFQSGTTLPVRIAYIEINPTAKKVALIPTCFRGRINTTYTFSSGALKSHRIIVAALFGNGESSSPSNTPTGFPDSLDYQDCVRAQHALLTDGLGISKLDVVLGFSMGGQCTYHWSVMYPQFLKHAVVICSSARTSRHNYQFLEGPKAALENSIDFPLENRKTSSTDGKALRGVQAFGKAYSAWLTSAEWFDEELWTEMGFKTLEEFDAAVTEVGYRDWSPEDLLIMLRMWQNGDVSAIENEGKKADSLEDALGKIQAKVLLMPCASDQYFRPGPNKREVKSVKHGEVAVIPSVWGHIAGGGASPKDTEWMNEKISQFLDKV